MRLVRNGNFAALSVLPIKETFNNPTDMTLTCLPARLYSYLVSSAPDLLETSQSFSNYIFLHLI